MLDTVKSRVNGLDLAALGEVVEGIEKDPSKAIVGFEVTTRWAGQTRSETMVEGFTLAGERIARTHKIVADEPCELLGGDSAPNPQELLMAAFNACITVGYVAGASVRGIKLDSLEIKTRRLRRGFGAQGHHSGIARDPHPRRARSARLPRPQR
jgi:organic hydroperoxide reductase OsmC/OhrA